MPPLHLVISSLCKLLVQRGGTRYTAGSDSLAIAVSKLALDILGFDPFYCASARACVEAVGLKDNRDSVGALLSRVHACALGLLRVVYAHNKLIASTLLPDMLPALLEAYLPQTSGPSSKASGYLRLSEHREKYSVGGSPIPLPLVATISLIQAGLVQYKRSGDLESDLEQCYRQGRRQVATFVSSLLKVMFLISSTGSC